MTEPLSLYYPKINQWIILYPNGYGISKLHNGLSHGLEIAVIKWKLREPSDWEKFRDGVKRLLKILMAQSQAQDPYYESDFVKGDVLKHPSFEEGGIYAVYSYLTSEQVKEIEEKVAALPKFKKCNKCLEEAVAEVEMGFRSIKAKIPFCEKHLIEWQKQMQDFKDIHDALVGDV